MVECYAIVKKSGEVICALMYNNLQDRSLNE